MELDERRQSRFRRHEPDRGSADTSLRGHAADVLQLPSDEDGRGLYRKHGEVYYPDEAPIPHALASVLKTYAIKLLTLFILQIQQDFEESPNRHVAKLIAYEPHKYIDQILGQRNQQKIVGLLEVFACDFIKAVCGDKVDARLSGGGKDGCRADQKAVQQEPTSRGQGDNMPPLRIEQDLPYLGGPGEGGGEASDLDKVAAEFLAKKVAPDELHYYQRLLRAVLLAFAREEGHDEQAPHTRRLRGEEGRVDWHRPRGSGLGASARWKSQSVTRNVGSMEPRSSSPPKRLERTAANKGQAAEQSSRNQNRRKKSPRPDDSQTRIVEERLANAERTIAQMRKDYMKDINQMRNQMWLNEKYQHLKLQKASKKYKGRESIYIDVQFFDSTLGLDPTALEALNKKLEMMRYQYDKSIMQLEDYNVKLRDQIHIFTQLEKTGNVGISFFEMNADSVISKLAVIEQDAESIWTAFDRHYHKGFFYNQIEQEFGITPETHGRLVEAFDSRIGAYKEQAELQVEEMTQKCEREIERLREQILDKELEVQQAKADAEQEILKQKEIIKEGAEIQLRNELAQHGKLHDAEKQEIFMEMRVLKKETGEIRQERERHEISSFLQKWMYLSSIRRLQSFVGSSSLQSEIVNEQEKFFDREMRRLANVNGGALSVLRDELKEVREEINAYNDQNNKLEFENFTLKNTIMARDEQIQEQQMALENLKNQVTMANKEQDMFRSEYYQYKSSYEQSQQYVGCLETTNQQLKDKIEKLNKIAERFNEKTEIADTTLGYAYRGQQKALNELHHNTSSKNKAIYGKKNLQDSASLTMIFGLKKEIVTQGAHILERPMVNKMAQTEPSVANQEVQVELTPALSRSQQSRSAERTPSRDEHSSSRKQLMASAQDSSGNRKKGTRLQSNQQVRSNQYSVEEPSREYGKITEKSSLSELSQEDVREDEDGDVDEVTMPRSKTRTRKQLRNPKSRHGKASRPRPLGADKLLSDDATNLEIDHGHHKTEIAALRKQKKSKKGKSDMRSKDPLAHQRENLNIFNAHHMEIILQRNLRLNIKTKETGVQTELSRTVFKKITQMQEMVQGLESESSSKRLARNGQRTKLQTAKGHSSSLSTQPTQKDPSHHLSQGPYNSAEMEQARLVAPDATWQNNKQLRLLSAQNGPKLAKNQAPVSQPPKDDSISLHGQLQICLTAQSIGNSTAERLHPAQEGRLDAANLRTTSRRNQRPMSGFAALEKDQDARNNNTNMLLASESRVDGWNHKTHLSLRQNKDAGMRARRKLVSINRNGSALERAGSRQCYRERKTYKGELASLNQNSTSALPAHDALDVQSLGQFDVAPWASQAQNTFPTALIEKPMSIRNMPIASSISQPNLLGQQRPQSRPYARFMSRADRQGKPLKAFQHINDTTFSRKSSDIYGANSTNRMSRDLKQGADAHQLSSSNTHQSSQGPTMLISEQTSQMAIEVVGALNANHSAKHLDQQRSRNVRVVGREKKQSMTTTTDGAGRLGKAHLRRPVPDSAQREEREYGDPVNNFDNEQALPARQVVSNPESQEGDHVPRPLLSQQRLLDAAERNNSGPSSLRDTLDATTDQRPSATSSGIHPLPATSLDMDGK